MLEYHRKKGTPHGGLFYTSILKQYRTTRDDEWVEVDQFPSATREKLAYQTMWSALPRAELKIFQQNPCRDTFKQALTTFKKNLYGEMGLTEGVRNEQTENMSLKGKKQGTKI